MCIHRNSEFMERHESNRMKNNQPMQMKNSNENIRCVFWIIKQLITMRLHKVQFRTVKWTREDKYGNRFPNQKLFFMRKKYTMNYSATERICCILFHKLYVTSNCTIWAIFKKIVGILFGIDEHFRKNIPVLFGIEFWQSKNCLLQSWSVHNTTSSKSHLKAEIPKFNALRLTIV